MNYTREGRETSYLEFLARSFLRSYATAASTEVGTNLDGGFLATFLFAGGG